MKGLGPKTDGTGEMNYDTFFVVESTYNPRFPYRITIRRDTTILLRLWVQDKWPTEGRKIFCIRENPDGTSEDYDVVEEVPVKVLYNYGKKLIVILDRTINKRSEFLFLKKRYKNKEGEYELIFWMTQKSLEEKRPAVRLNTTRLEDVEIIIDNREKHPYKFAADVRYERLPAGDYALSYKGQVVAVVERKRYNDILDQLTNMAELNVKLAEIKPYRYKALVIEADYSDFLNPKKLRIVSGNFGAKLIGELYAYHPEIQIVFARSRKLGNEWVARYFAAISAILRQGSSDVVKEVVTKYEQPELFSWTDLDIRNYILNNCQGEFSKNDIRERFPDVEKRAVDRVINSMICDGSLMRVAKNRFLLKKEGV